MNTYAYDTADDALVRLVTVIDEGVNYLPDNVLNKALVKEVPDRTFRAAWCFVDGQLGFDYAIIRGTIRNERNNSLQALDIKALAADRAGNTSKLDSINTLAQQLRDLPNNPDFNSNDINKLKELYALSKLVSE